MDAVGLPRHAHAAIGSVTAAAMDATETYFVAIANTTQTTSAVKPTSGTHANRTPPVVATPLPPLNFSQQV